MNERPPEDQHSVTGENFVCFHYFYGFCINLFVCVFSFVLFTCLVISVCVFDFCLFIPSSFPFCSFSLHSPLIFVVTPSPSFLLGLFDSFSRFLFLPRSLLLPPFHFSFLHFLLLFLRLFFFTSFPLLLQVW